MVDVVQMKRLIAFHHYQKHNNNKFDYQEIRLPV